MLEYPSIDGRIVDTPIRAFPKYDGVNVRVKWTRQRGFATFGSRRQLIDENTPIFGVSVGLWRTKYEEAVTQVLKKARVRQAMLFGELYGPTSFAGHLDLNESLDVMLYDMMLDDDQMLTQTELAKLLRGIDIAPVLYEGKPTELLRQQVKRGELPGQTLEGIICKGGRDNRGRPVMFKMKSDAWYEQLRLHCAGNQALFDQLA